MKIFTKLTLRNLKLNKKRTIGTIIGIMLSTALICAVAGMATSLQKSMVATTTVDTGYYHLQLKKVTNADVEKFKNNRDVKDVNVLNDVGYTSKALHPYYASGYRRDYVYPFLAFSSFDTIDTLPEIETLDGRWYASDQYTYKQIIKQFEEKKEGEKLFSYTVTMQNHGGYSDPDFVSDVTLTDFDDPSAMNIFH